MVGMRVIKSAAALLSVLVPTASMTDLFVYGTLKRGQPNYFRMTDAGNGRAEYLGTARTVERLPLVIAGKYNIPFLLNVPGTGQRVRGEVYRVDAPMLAFLDKFESCPAMYQRTPVRLEVEEWAGEGGPSPGSLVEAFVYSTTTYQPEWLALPTHESYDHAGDHGLSYVSREYRD
ncbi:gamma-glutamylaminecyclotransferase-like isoform X1 [Anguilla anguilla]|uniref:gamma-glutamylaminecyclotransferase-like isoform X1 n=2 Tax=Anguilla anguilla TaxID=7936 RepID=UPI0015AEB88D|nr:gamma-glutamylaminecyclotransferase-like isoform X1 [Anguilla anguilla]XP_035249157.1 gamma-glutamylaminecyclotransferase-like isoform X1 [Anguilla anguilla]